MYRPRTAPLPAGAGAVLNTVPPTIRSSRLYIETVRSRSPTLAEMALSTLRSRSVHWKPVVRASEFTDEHVAPWMTVLPRSVLLGNLQFAPPRRVTSATRRRSVGRSCSGSKGTGGQLRAGVRACVMGFGCKRRRFCTTTLRASACARHGVCVYARELVAQYAQACARYGV
jgi:hypothetical protein